ncbi:pericentrin-like isoform X3, partial [Brachionus plicatilis]
YVKNNPDDFMKQQNLNSKKLAVLEHQFFELEKHTNNLDQLLIQEKAKYEKLAKAYSDLKARYNNLGAVNNGNNLERIRQSLEYLAIKHKEEIDSKPASNEVRHNLNSIINELENVSSASSSSSFFGQNVNSTDLETKLLRQNRELLGSVKKLTNEKSEFRGNVQKLEEELWILRNKSQKAQINSNAMSDSDKEKFKKLYIKYLRAESFRKSLVYQKRFLLIMLSGYEETEREIMTTLKLETNSTLKNNKYALVQENNKNGSFYYSSRFTIHKAKSRFRTAAICIIAINRIKFLQRKHSYMSTRVDSHRSN